MMIAQTTARKFAWLRRRLELALVGVLSGLLVA